MKKLYRQSMMGEQNLNLSMPASPVSISQAYTSQESMSLDLSMSSQSGSRYSVSSTYSYARQWTDATNDLITFKDGRVLKPHDSKFKQFLIIRCILRLIIVYLALFGSTFMRSFTEYFIEQNNDILWWTSYKKAVVFLILSWILDILDILSLILDCLYLDRGMESSETRKQIIKYHLTDIVIVLDCIGCLPLDMIAVGIGSNHVSLIFYLRLIKLMKLPSMLSDFHYLLTNICGGWAVYQHPISRNVFYCCLLYLSLLTVYANGWFAITFEDKTYERLNSFVADDDIMKSFSTSIYYILVTMCAVGYGDIVPGNTRQVLLALIVEVTGFITLTIIIGSLVPYIFQQKIEEFEFTHRLDLILRYLLKIANNDQQLKEKTLEYFSWQWRKCKGLDDNQIYSYYLPLHLRREVGDQIVGKILKEEKFFADAPSSFIRCLTDHLVFGFYLENDIIFAQEIILDKLPILYKGAIEEFTYDVSQNNKRVLLRAITDGRMFAQMEFICGQPISSNFESKTNGLEILYIEQRHWKQLLEQYPKVAAHIFEYTLRRNNNRGVIKSQQSNKLHLMSAANDENEQTNKSIEGLFLPKAQFVQIWNMLYFIGLLIYVFLNSILIAFNNARALNLEIFCMLGLLWMVDIFFMVDIYVRKTLFAVRINGRVFSDPEYVSRYYMKHYFWLDFCSLIPFELFLLAIPGGSSNKSYVVLGRINRFLHCYRFLHSFQTALDILRCTGSKRNIAMTASWMIIMLHLIACTWYAVGDSSSKHENSWIFADPTLDASSTTLHRYLRSMYFAFLTTFTVGYGGIVPVNFGEQIVCCMLILIGTSAYFTILALITVWAEQANRIALSFERNFEIVKHVLHELQVTEAVNDDVRSFMSQLWTNQYGYRDEKVLSLLPRNIRVSIMDNLSLGVLAKIPFFFHVPKSFMDELLLAFTIKTFCPKEILFRGNTISDFFIICQGSCVLQACTKKNKKKEEANVIVKQMNCRDYFGLEAFELYSIVKDRKKEMQKRMSVELEDESLNLLQQNIDEERKKEEDAFRKIKQRVKKHRLSYYTCFENEMSAIENCPFTDFCIKADINAFVTIMAMTNDEFEDVLKKFPKVKQNILKSVDIERESTLMVSANDESEIEITFEHTNVDDNDSNDDSHDDDNDDEFRISDIPMTVNINNNSRSSHRRDGTVNTIMLANSSAIVDLGYLSLIGPVSDFKLWWNLISIVFILYNTMSVPYVISFIANDVSINAAIIIFDICLDIFFCVDIYLRLNRFTYDEEGFEEKNKSVIRNKYIGIKLVADIISSFPWEFICMAIIISPTSFSDFFGNSQIHIYHWLRFSCMLRLHNFSKHVSEIEQYIAHHRIRISPTMLQISNLVVFLLIVCHWGASMFYGIAKSGDEQQYNWLKSEDSPIFYESGKIQSAQISYFLSAYWSLSTMSSVGFGDIKPRTFGETCVGLIVMVLGILTYASATAVIAAFAAHANPPSEAFRERTQPVEKYIKTLKLSSKLKTCSQNYFQELWKSFKGVSPHTAIQCLSGSLQDRVLESILVPRLQPLDIFADAPLQFIKTCAQNMEHELYVSGEKIVIERTENRKLFFLFGGKAKGISGARSGCLYAAGDTWSKQSLISPAWTEPGTIVAVTHCHVFTLHRERFSDVVSSKKAFKHFLFSSNFAKKAHSLLMNEAVKDIEILVNDKQPLQQQLQPFISYPIFKVIIFCALLFNMWMITFSYAFLSRMTTDMMWVQITVLVFSWMTDIIFWMHWITKIIFTKNKAIAKSHQNGSHFYANVKSHFYANKIQFILHTASLLPIDMVLFLAAFPNHIQYACLARFIRLMQIYQFNGFFAGFMEVAFATASPLPKLLLQIIPVVYLLIHNLACLWFISSKFDYKLATAQQTMSDNNPLELYLHCLYYAMTVVTTTGYGDITPQTNAQIGFSMCLILTGNIIYAGVIGTISSWVSSTYARDLEHFNQMKELHSFCELKKLTPQLCSKILEHHNKSLMVRSRESTMQLFPPRLQKKCSLEIYGKYIASFDYFKNLRNSQLSRLVRNIHTEAHLKGDVILSRGDLNDKLRIILNGKVYILRFHVTCNTNDNNTHADLFASPSRRSTASRGSRFGDYSFFMSQPADLSAIAAEDTQVLLISRHLLINMLQLSNHRSNAHHNNATLFKTLEKIANIECKEETAENNDESEISEEDNRNLHPFVIFLKYFLANTDVYDEQLIIKAASIWKINIDVIKKFTNKYKHKERSSVFIQQKTMAMEVNKAEQENSEEEYSMELQSEIIENIALSPRSYLRSSTYYTDHRNDNQALDEIRQRFKNHDMQGVQNCIVL